MKKLFISIVICFFFTASFSQKVYVFDSTCRLAYNEIIKLKLDHGRELINKAHEENADNLIPDLLEGYIDFFVLFFNEDSAEYRLRKENFDKRLSAFDSGPHNTPFYRFSKAVTYLQRAAVKIKFGERYSAGWDFKKANSQIKENRSAYPKFQPNKMIYGPLEVVIGTVPQGYRWITNLFGMKGSINEGMQHMRSLLSSNDDLAKLFSNEATFYYCYLMFYIENKPDEVFKLIRAKKLDIVNNHLFTYLAANLALNSKQTEYARQIVQQRNMSADYMQTPAWDFELGYTKFHKLQLDEAIASFQKFINTFKGKFYVKDVLQKLSWAYYLKGNKEEAEKYRQLTIRNGNTDSDADKQAYRDAKKGLWPDETLLKARILNDGGYNKEALAILNKKNIEDYTKPEEKLEYAYRMGRIYDDMGKDDEAIQFYDMVVKLGKERTEYFAARAALQLGFIYEKSNQKTLAIASFQKCLDMGDHEYKDSLDQRAKSGIARCKGE
ncbi:tetratricopeptide repeat protein [Segetibacter koreensis]|uniref:tetratricopeptide repeat protein n=1 Tax=Segetibacter koreensis TaxID=398037 RepID=UPI000363EAC6|nr:tetratricopeptide repeat protein [Segetibacter koreensis]